jgi:transcriptional/translational regulatory protein YebC/TACO1
VLVGGEAAEDEVMLAALDAGAEDVADDGGTWRITCDPSRTFEIKAALEVAGFDVLSADSPMVSETLVPVTEIDDARKVLRILEAIEDNDDVQDVYSNFDMDDDVLEAAAG